MRRDARRQPRLLRPARCRTRTSGCPDSRGPTRFTSPTLSRFELARPFPAFGTRLSSELHEHDQRNDGSMNYDSMQFVANKRWAKGLTINATYTWVPALDRDGRQHHDRHGDRSWTPCRCSRTSGPYFSHREHRITASGVWEMPWLRDRRDFVGMLLGGWSIAPMFIYQSGQPWTMPGNVDLAVDPAVAALNAREGRAVHLRRRAVRGPAQRRHGVATTCCRSRPAYGCTEPFFLVREAFQRRTAMVRYDEFRRPAFWQVDLNFAKTTPITDRVMRAVPRRGVQHLQQPDVRRARVQPDDDVRPTSGASTATRRARTTSSASCSSASG